MFAKSSINVGIQFNIYFRKDNTWYHNYALCKTVNCTVSLEVFYVAALITCLVEIYIKSNGNYFSHRSIGHAIIGVKLMSRSIPHALTPMMDHSNIDSRS